MDAYLKDQFDLKAFHTFLLDIGPAQFSIIQPYFRLWLAEQMDQQDEKRNLVGIHLATYPTLFIEHLTN